MQRFLIVFLLIIGCDLTFIWCDLPYRWISKPLVMLSLMAYYVYHRKSHWNKIDVLFVVALCCAWLGDVLLLWDDLFLFGLGAFLLMQILYIVLFIKHKDTLQQQHYIYALGLITWIVIASFILWPHLGEMKIPVVIYTGAIGLMAWWAAARIKNTHGYWMIVIGTLFFMISDTTLAIHLFSDIDLGKLTVMSTYAAAQYFIVMGFLDQQSALDSVKSGIHT